MIPIIPINDLGIYNAGMEKSMLDKIWWFDKIGSDILSVTDYGCANGALLSMVHRMDSTLNLYGYDFNEDMIDLAGENIPDATFSNSFRSIVNDVDTSSGVLIASSVFHEIHNYSCSVDSEYTNIFQSGYKYIAIRDMFVSSKSFYQSDGVSVAKIRQRFDRKLIDEFESYCGHIDRNENLLQFLLTYRYKENWDREVRENYFPYTIEEFLNRIPKCYEVVHFEHYVLPFVRECVAVDFGIDVPGNTHAKILLRLKLREAVNG